MPASDTEEFVMGFNLMAALVYRNAVNKGFWPEDRNTGEAIALIHSELSEALEGLRKPGPDEHCPEFTKVEVELADAIIRIMDLAAGNKWRIAAALVAKHEYNLGRSYMHGKNF
jgi:hypothetical protein